MEKEKLEMVWIFCMVAVAVFMLYYTIAPSIFYDERTAKVSCPVVKASTVITKQDGGGETSHRAVEVSCDYSITGVPRFLEKATVETHLGRVAGELPAVTKGDFFVCTATWREYSPLALVAKGTYTNLKFDLEGCRLATR